MLEAKKTYEQDLVEDSISVTRIENRHKRKEKAIEIYKIDRSIRVKRSLPEEIESI